jgi:hypothetical protein
MTMTTRTVFGAIAVAAAVGLGVGVQTHAAAGAQPPGPRERVALTDAQQTALVKQYCVTCHTEAEKPGGLSLETFEGADHAPANIAAMMARKLKAGQMPPPGMPRPDEATLKAFIGVLESAAVPGMADAPASAAPPAAGPEIIPFAHTGDTMTVAEQNRMVHTICTQCHTDTRKPGGLSFEHFDMATATANAKVAEDMLAKLRAGMMPKASAPKRPDQASIHAFVVSLERRLDQQAARHPDAGFRVFQRLNRVEYANSIRTMLGLDVDVSQWLPPDTMSHNFDNIANVQTFSPTLLQSYLDAADVISRLAIGDPATTGSSTTYTADASASQMDHVDGAPYDTRGGVAAVHVFPADGTYQFKLTFFRTVDGNLFGMSKGPGMQIEVSVDGQRVALFDIDPQMNEAQPQGLTLTTDPIRVTAGSHQIAAAFIRLADGPIDDLLEPHRYTLADQNIGDGAGVTTLPHLRSLGVTGPYAVTGVSDTISRRKIFICRPVTPAEELPCATSIVGRLAGEAYRRPVRPAELQDLMRFYTLGDSHGGFEAGIRTALQSILASPQFLFRIERQPAAVVAHQDYRIGDLALASRLSYFLWATPPDSALLDLARKGRLHEPAVLDAQVTRMLDDPRSFALATRFAAQWLRLQDVDKVRPDALAYPQYDANLGDDMKRETELFFNSIVREDRNVLALLTADYTFVNQRLATFYGIPGIAGPQFRKVSLAGTPRRGLLGEGSILVETSVADRSDPVLRGKWVLEVFLGQPPPPPPPGVNTNLDDTAGAVQNGKALSVRERMAVHRANPFCASCHSVIDPIGLALENFDPTGHWRINDNSVPVDNATTLYDGTKMTGLPGLVAAMLGHQDTFLRVFTGNLMAYALGRQVEYYDMPTVRSIVRRAAQHDNHFSSFVLGVVHSDAFLMKQAGAAATETTAEPRH